MTVADKLSSPTSRFWYWVKERHRIHQRRREGRAPPWTNDPILQNFFFTNPYRENDKTTVWFRENFRTPLRNRPVVMFGTVMFRWFNRIETAEVLFKHALHLVWNGKLARRVLSDIEGPVFTGAYVIKSPDGKTKIDGICWCIQNIWRARDSIISRIEGGSLENAHQVFMEFPFLGGFMAYEIVSDLRHTYLLDKADDKHSWCFLGPGATRGIRRLAGLPPKGPLPPNSQEILNKLLKMSVAQMRGHKQFEMREIEHSLCEFDKFERIRLNEGKSKRRFHG